MDNRNSNMSKLDKLTGKHTVNIIIALLFIITLLAYVVMSCLASDSGQSTNALFSNLLSGLVGLFGGNNFRK